MFYYWIVIKEKGKKSWTNCIETIVLLRDRDTFDCLCTCVWFYISSMLMSGCHKASVGRETLSIPQNWSGSQEMNSLCHLCKEKSKLFFSLLILRVPASQEDSRAAVRSHHDRPHVRAEFLVFFHLYEVKEKKKVRLFRSPMWFVEKNNKGEYRRSPHPEWHTAPFPGWPRSSGCGPVQVGSLCRAHFLGSVRGGSELPGSCSCSAVGARLQDIRSEAFRTPQASCFVTFDSSEFFGRQQNDIVIEH